MKIRDSRLFAAHKIDLFTGAFFLFLVCTTAFADDSLTSVPASTVFYFLQSIGSESDTVSRSISTQAKETIITFENPPNLATRAVCDSHLRIRSWHFEDKETGYDVTAARTNDTIRIAGKKGTKALRKSIAIDSLPWYQAMEFSLRSFLKACDQSCEFWIIRPTDMQAFKMTARKKGTESIRIGGREEPTVKVTLSPCGILGRLWHATYWYGMNGFELLKSEIPRGPGSSPTIMEAIDMSRPQ